eukprot:CAMPEP_0179422556 /NCGR_PEP_ID=MMETSP0799-20121207/10496_1 /TAXON_ID=46947 /ORGANISM="Geminigera cryophila, Strain CCMP2564" /LENGTH=84 /DNA_ID=CAMNT_0021196705 /DNA_START=892 /DNA_END=1146 /DNA_ORIENTATION=-
MAREKNPAEAVVCAAMSPVRETSAADSGESAGVSAAADVCSCIGGLMAASSTAAASSELSKPLACTAGDSSSTFAEIDTELVKA